MTDGMDEKEAEGGREGRSVEYIKKKSKIKSLCLSIPELSLGGLSWT